MKESWFPIKRYHGRYEVSNLGYVRNAKTQNEVHEKQDATGRRLARITRRPGVCEWVPVKELVAVELLHATSDAAMSVIHADGNPANCSRDNLVLDTGTGTPLPAMRNRTSCGRGHELVRWNLTSDGRCRTCKLTREKLRKFPGVFDESEYQRRYRELMPAAVRQEPDPVPEFFDRRGVGVFDMYVSF